MKWIQDLISPESRNWEEFYRNRWQHDKVVRSTHGVNCTGSCSWDVYVKEGIVTWEFQALDYPQIDPEIPPYEPRGCQRGISFSWYLYSPIRVKFPLVRGALMDMWKEAKKKFNDPVEAWASIQEDESKRTRFQRARGKGGFRRMKWDDALEIISAANLYTVKKYGPDRITGFSPIPAMSMVSYASGARFLQLLGGVCLSFYDWYCDLPPASPEIWGEQTDVAESADWYNSKFIACMGANLNMTRTPDCHYVAEARHNGTKLVVFSPDFNQVAKFADEWVPVHPGQDGAFWMAVGHVILKEYHADKTVPYFHEYLKKYTDCPFLIEIEKSGDTYVPGKFVRANLTSKYKDVENGEWKFLVMDKESKNAVMPKGSVGHRWQSKHGDWNLLWEDGLDNTPFEPELSFVNEYESTLPVAFTEFSDEKTDYRHVPVRYLETAKGRIAVTTVFDLLMGQYAVDRGFAGDYAKSYDEMRGYTPAWQEKLTGISRDNVIKFAREWAQTADDTKGKCCIIIGAGVDHWYHNNLIYRAGINSLMFCGCIGVNGGGLNHYVGQEKLAPQASWSSLAFAKDWQGPSRLQNAPSWHYMHSDQWRYDGEFRDYHRCPDSEHTRGHTADMNVKAVKNGWLPFFPQFNVNPLDLAQKIKAATQDPTQYAKKIVEQLKSGEIKYSIEDPDAEKNWPRVWYIWRGNAIMSSAKGHEYFLKHYLGTDSNSIAPEMGEGKVKDVNWMENAPTGKMDLIVDLNFRMDTSALYSDIVLPAASWYEKADLNTTDMHSFIHPLAKAIEPVWESKSDWAIFKNIAKATSKMAEKHMPDPVIDVVNVPLLHDTPDEITQPNMKDWSKGEIEAIPGKSMHKMLFVERDYTQIYNKYISMGPLMRKQGVTAHGIVIPIEDFYDDSVKHGPTVTWGGNTYPSLEQDEYVCDAILKFAPETNGELAHRAYLDEQHHVGLPLTDLAAASRDVRMTYKDLQSKPHRLLNSPVWSGLVDVSGRTYSAYTYNIEKLVPWRTLTGRQSFYLDHDGYIQFGENLPTYKPSPLPKDYGDLRTTERTGEYKILNYLTPHGKWHIHSTYGDTQRMFTLSRGIEPFWISEEDAADLGIADNDWVEVINDHGVVCTRACVSARIPRGVGMIYHSPERMYDVPKSPSRGNKRAGGHNSLIRARLKPNLMVGGYAQFTYAFNYWGPTGCNRDTHILVRKLNKLEY